jgi:hypothetical protein
MLLPALTRARAKAQNIQCLSNGRQIMLGWRIYADDNRDILVAALGGTGGLFNGRPVWITGILDYNAANASNWDIQQDIAKSPQSNVERRTSSQAADDLDYYTSLSTQTRLPNLRRRLRRK